MHALFNDSNFVGTGNLSVREISIARMADKLTVIEEGYGFVPKDWLQAIRELRERSAKKRKIAEQPALSPYRKNVKASLVEGLLKAGFNRESETSLRRVTTSFTEYTVTLSDKHFELLTQERSLADGWIKTRYAYTYEAIKSVTLRQFW